MPDPSSYDNQDDFISACIAQRQDEHPEEDTDQSAAVCYSMWEDKSVTPIVHKTISSEVKSSDGALEFVLSDASIDRYGDSIDPNGWDLRNFMKNPIALFNHNSDFPIGRWEGLGVKDNALRGHLKMAPAGVSPRHDELRALIDAGILRAVSVGFMPIESKARSQTQRGELYLKQELVETSLVSVPANPNAILLAKSLGISDATRNLVFRQARQDETLIGRGIESGTTLWRGKEVQIKRYETGSWRGQKLYRYD